jgi:hypothetical protein
VLAHDDLGDLGLDAVVDALLLPCSRLFVEVAFMESGSV